MPKIREFRTSDSAVLTTVLTTKLLNAKRQNRRPAFNFMDRRQVSMSFTQDKDEQNIRYLLQNATFLERLHLSIDSSRSLVGLRAPSARFLKILDFTVCLYDESSAQPLAGLCEELEGMAGHNSLEALYFEVHVNGHETKEFIGTIIQNMEKVLLKLG